MCHFANYPQDRVLQIVPAPSTDATKLAAIQSAMQRITQNAIVKSESRSLSSELRGMSKKVGKKSYARRCPGSTICNNKLCDHRSAAGHSSNPRQASNLDFLYGMDEKKKADMPTDEVVIDERILAMVMKKCKDDGFEVSEPFARLHLQMVNGKLVPGIKAIKEEIQYSESPFLHYFLSLPHSTDFGRGKADDLRNRRDYAPWSGPHFIPKCPTR